MPTYALDTTGASSANKITAEAHTLSQSDQPDYHIVVPRWAPFFADDCIVKFTPPSQPQVTLTEGIDYIFTHHYIGASRACAKPIYGSINILDMSKAGQVHVTYQTLGGDYTLDENALLEILANRLYNPRSVSWEVIAEVPEVFPPTPHAWKLVDMIGATELIESITGITDAIQAGNLLRLGRNLITWANTGAWQITGTTTYNGSGLLTAANIRWPDGTVGTYTATANGTNAALRDGWVATYVGSTITRTITQPMVTRNGSLQITAQPAVTFA